MQGRCLTRSLVRGLPPFPSSMQLYVSALENTHCRGTWGAVRQCCWQMQNVHAVLSSVRAFNIIPYLQGRSLQARGPHTARDAGFTLPARIFRIGKRSFNTFFCKSRDRTPKQFLKLLNCLCMETYITLLISCVKMCWKWQPLWTLYFTTTSSSSSSSSSSYYYYYYYYYFIAHEL